MIVVVKYIDRDSETFGAVIEQEFTNVFEVDRNDDTFFTVVHDHEGVTFEDMIVKGDILWVEINHEADLITPAKEARENYRQALEEQERQARVQASGLSLA